MHATDNNVSSLNPVKDNTRQKRIRMFSIFAAILAALALIYSAYWFFYASNHISTNNAYTDANIAQMTAATNGIVKSINVVDTQRVKAGDVLVVLDDEDAKLNLEQAEANVVRYTSDLTRTTSSYGRRKKLATSGFTSQEELNGADNALKSAQANVDAANAALKKARLDLSRSEIRAPIDGIVAKRQVQLGQSIGVGTYLLSIIPDKHIVVNANFKEVQLQKLKVGQPVTMRSDLYGSSFTFHGRVVGIAGGTGASFAIIPAQNATGNWIKVVQRVPVRIEIDADDLVKHPLQVGLSMTTDVYIGKRNT